MGRKYEYSCFTCCPKFGEEYIVRPMNIGGENGSGAMIRWAGLPRQEMHACVHIILILI